MSRVFVSEGTGAAIYVFTDDHCPPHVHARHRGEGWVARIRFSYVTNAVELISIAPLKNVPLQRVVNRLLDDIQTRLADCRRSWRETKRTTCLANQRGDALIDQPAREVGVVRRTLAADADILAAPAAGADRHGEKALDRLVTLVEVLRHDRGVPIESEGEL